MRILQVLPYLEAAGTERHALTLSEGLMAKGHEIMLLAPAGPLEDAFKVRDIPHVKFPGFGENVRAALRGLATGMEQAVNWGAEVVHVHAGVELLYGVQRVLRHGPRPAVVFTVHSYFGKWPQVDYFFAARFGRRWADHVIAVSHADGATLNGHDKRLAGMLSVVHNGMPATHPVSSLERRAARVRLTESFGVPPGAVLCLVVGRLAAQKGIDVLLNGLAVYEGPPVAVLVAGGGELKEQLTAQSEALGLAGPGHVQVVFLGPRDDVPHLLSGADLFVLPSRMEGLSLALIEAHAAGVPCLVTDVGGNGEIVVDYDTGRIVPAEDVAALAGALAEMTADMPALRAMGEAARQRYESHFTARRMVRDTLTIYETLVQSR